MRTVIATGASPSGGQPIASCLSLPEINNLAAPVALTSGSALVGKFSSAWRVVWNTWLPLSYVMLTRAVRSPEGFWSVVGSVIGSSKLAARLRLSARRKASIYIPIPVNEITCSGYREKPTTPFVH